jgi:hypothetical protein
MTINMMGLARAECWSGWIERSMNARRYPTRLVWSISSTCTISANTTQSYSKAIEATQRDPTRIFPSKMDEIQWKLISWS